jgi:tRNA-dihydrouridine synthase
MKAAGVGIPVVATNRINTPAVAERVLEGGADLVSMARPFLADAEFMNKAKGGRADEINTCIACNQACLDHIFQNKRASCLVNPRACHETELVYTPATRRLRVAVFFTGDELAMPGEPLKPGAIYNSNRFTLRGLLENLGCDFTDYGIVPDSLQATRETLREAAGPAP